jgi:hypothetical protein
MARIQRACYGHSLAISRCVERDARQSSSRLRTICRPNAPTLKLLINSINIIYLASACARPVPVTDIRFTNKTDRPTRKSDDCFSVTTRTHAPARARSPRNEIAARNPSSRPSVSIPLHCDNDDSFGASRLQGSYRSLPLHVSPCTQPHSELDKAAIERTANQPLSDGLEDWNR